MSTFRYPLVRPDFPSSEQIEQYFAIARRAGLFSNRGLVYNLACDKLSRIYNNSNPVLVNNGTTAIQVALMTTLPRGSRVALPTFTFTATLNAVVAAGMIPVLFDVNAVTWQTSMYLLNEHADKYDAFIVVSPFGYAVDVKEYDKLAEELGKPVVYDFAPAWGHPISSVNPTTFSFHATKTLPIGEGGVVMFPNKHQKANAEALINFNFNQFSQPMNEYGFNGKMDELHASVLCAQLDRANELQKSTIRSQDVAETIMRNEKWQVQIPPITNGSYLQLPVIRVWPSQIHNVIEALTKRSMASREYYKPHLHEAFPDLEFIFEEEIRSPLSTLGLPRPQSNIEVEDIVRAVLEGLRK